MFDHEQVQLQREILKVLKDIRHELRRSRIEKAIITQGQENSMSVSGTIKGLAPGAVDSFFATVVDANGNAPTNPVVGLAVGVFTVDDQTVTLQPSADGFSVVATASANAAPGGSFNLTWTAIYTDPNTGATSSITGTANVPYLQGTVAGFVPAGAVLSQGSPAV